MLQGPLGSGEALVKLGLGVARTSNMHTYIKEKQMEREMKNKKEKHHDRAMTKTSSG